MTAGDKCAKTVGKLTLGKMSWDLGQGGKHLICISIRWRSPPPCTFSPHRRICWLLLNIPPQKDMGFPNSIYSTRECIINSAFYRIAFIMISQLSLFWRSILLVRSIITLLQDEKLTTTKAKKTTNINISYSYETISKGSPKFTPLTQNLDLTLLCEVLCSY